MPRLETGKPYYILPYIEAYRKLDPASEKARELSRLIAINIGDYAALRLVLGIDPPEFAKFYPDMDVATPSTMDTIDSFLDKFGGNIAPGSYIPELPESLDNEEHEHEQPEEEKNSVKKKKTNGQKEDREETKSLSELIKEGLFDEAIKFIEAENLNNPQKNIYFAHQIRYISC